MSNDLTLYPTLLHFSTYHGLDQLTSALLDCPGSQHALKVPNSNGQTPLDIANQAGHHDLAEILRAHQHDPPKLSHIYDYIKQASSRPISSGLSDYSGPDPAYQVPPPPRPLESTPTKNNCNYLDMSGSNTPPPCPHRKMRHHERNMQDLLNQLTLKPVAHSTLARYNLEAGATTVGERKAEHLRRIQPLSSESHLNHADKRIPTESHPDPFVKMRGTVTRRSLKEKSNVNKKEILYVNDPFGTLRASRASSAPKSFSSDDVFISEDDTKTTTETEKVCLNNSFISTS